MCGIMLNRNQNKSEREREKRRSDKEWNKKKVSSHVLLNYPIIKR